MTAFLILVVVVLAALIWLVGRMYRKNTSIDPVLKVVQALLTAIALLLAGLWYFVERKGMSHAEIHLDAKGVHVAPGIALLQLRIETKNVGYIVLHAHQWKVRLLSVVPSDLPLDKLVRLKRDVWPARLGGVDAYYVQELDWKPLRAFDDEDVHEVEPGEVDVKTMDFIVPCTLQVGRVTVALQKRDTGFDWDRLKQRLMFRKPAPLWWKDRLLVSFLELCAGPVGTVADLAHGGGAGGTGESAPR
jgi:hypothetical protein